MSNIYVVSELESNGLLFTFQCPVVCAKGDTLCKSKTTLEVTNWWLVVQQQIIFVEFQIVFTRHMVSEFISLVIRDFSLLSSALQLGQLMGSNNNMTDLPHGFHSALFKLPMSINFEIQSMGPTNSLENGNIFTDLNWVLIFQATNRFKQ